MFTLHGNHRVTLLFQVLHHDDLRLVAGVEAFRKRKSGKLARLAPDRFYFRNQLPVSETFPLKSAALKKTLLLKPGAAGCDAQTLPLCHAALLWPVL